MGYQSDMQIPTEYPREAEENAEATESLLTDSDDTQIQGEYQKETQNDEYDESITNSIE